MPQNRETGAAAVRYGIETARKIAAVIGAVKVGDPRSNEYDWTGRKIAIRCARRRTSEVGVTHKMLERVDTIIGSFEKENGSYDLYGMTRRMYSENMTPTQSQGRSSGQVGKVKKSVFINKCRLLRTIRI